MDTCPVTGITSQAENQEVQVRGFLYRADDGEWVLSDQPGLKCCCVHKQKHKIIVDGLSDFEESCRPVVVRGVLRMQSGQMLLTESALVSESLPWWGLFPVVFIIIVAAGGLWLWRKRS